jgi:hypothetical protein
MRRIEVIDQPQQKIWEIPTNKSWAWWCTPMILALVRSSLMPTAVAHACHPSYSRGRFQEDQSSKPPWANSSWDPILKKPTTKKGWWYGSRCRPWFQIPVPKTKQHSLNNLGSSITQYNLEVTAHHICHNLSMRKESQDAKHGGTFCNPNTWEAEAGWPQIRGQCGLHSMNLSQKEK